MVITRRVATKYGPVTIAKWLFLVSVLALLPIVPSKLPEQHIFSGEATLPSAALLGFAFVFSTTLAFFCMPLALKKLEAGTVSIFMNIQPIVASVVAIGVGQDSFTLLKGLAALLVLAGGYLVPVVGRTRAVRVATIAKG